MSTEAIASALRALGTGNAATEMGAIEFLAAAIKESADTLAASIDGLADAVRESGANA